MLFYLKNSLITSEDDVSFSSIYRSVRYIAEQVEASSHLLTGDFEVIEHFRKVFKNDPILSILFDKIYQHYSEYIVPNFITFYLEIVKDNPLQQRVEGDKLIAQIEYSHFSTLESASTSVLMGEDSNDGKFYGHVMQWYIKKYASRAHVSLNFRHGGGVNTAREIGSYLDQGVIVLAIIDTDKKYPNCRPKRDGTYDRCVKLHRTEPYYKLLPIDVHEIENLIPRNYIQACHDWSNPYSNDTIRKNKIDKLYNDSEHTLPYFDFKKGLIVCDDMRNKPDYKEYARACYNADPEKLAQEPDFDKFLANTPNDTEIYPLLFGGSGLSTRTIDLIEDEVNCPEPSLLAFQEENWKKIGQEMINWGICRGKERLY